MKRLLPVVAALAAASLACSINVNLPRLKTGPTETLTVNQPLPDAEEVDVTLKMGAGNFKLAGGADGLATGEIKYNVPEWKPTITAQDGKLTIEQGPAKGNFGITEGNDVVNDWDLKLGDAPMNLTINAGAYRGALDLSGLRLRNLDIADGASDSEVTFASVNPEEMAELRYTTGASSVKLTGLANANFAVMTFKGGAGDYTLDFSGELQRDGAVDITSGVSSIKIVIPEGTAAKITVSGAINDVRTDGTWTVDGQTYSVPGSGATLTIHVDMGVGSLKLVSK